MICPECNGKITGEKEVCSHCKADLKIYNKIVRLSNVYYNIALEQGRIRDLSGAIKALRNSLKLNKHNFNSRNLLGLIYFETGETVKALSEWVISKHLKEENNDADIYINAIQKNPTRLEGLNQTIKRYNSALISAHQGNDDIAIIQLKKVVSLNPKYVSAYHLLALLHMKNGDEKQAKQVLNKAKEIDLTNVKTLRYLAEIEAKDDFLEEKDPLEKKDTDLNIRPLSSYREDKPNVMAYINLILGVLVGIAVTATLIIPNIKREYNLKNNNELSQLKSEIVKQEELEELVDKLRGEKDDLEKQAEGLQKDLDGANALLDVGKEGTYDPLFEAVNVYLSEMEKPESERDILKIAGKVALVDESELQTEATKNLLKTMKDVSYLGSSELAYRKGHNLYSSKKYQEALTELESAYNYDKDNMDAIYFIGRSYHQLDDKENAAKYYNLLIDDFPGTERAKLATEQMRTLQ